MTYLQLNLEEGEAYALRVILSQTASPGSLQSRLITRLDAVREEAKRERNPAKRRPVMTKAMLPSAHHRA